MFSLRLSEYTKHHMDSNTLRFRSENRSDIPMLFVSFVPPTSDAGGIAMPSSGVQANVFSLSKQRLVTRLKNHVVITVF